MLEQQGAGENVFLRDLRACREHGLTALGGIVQGEAQTALSIDLLQSVLTAEVICVLRYTLLSVSEDGLKHDRLATEFQAQANDERRHMAMLARRIEALGGVPDFSATGLGARFAALGRARDSFAELLRQNLAAEQCLVEHYRELAAYFAPHDPETAAILRDILQDEEDHTRDIQDLLVSGA